VADMKRALVRVSAAEMEAALHLETEATIRATMDPETHERIAGFGKG